MSSARHLDRLSGWGKTVFYTHGHWTQNHIVIITKRVVSTSYLKCHKWESYIAWWANRIPWHRWYIVFRSILRTILSGSRRREISWSQIVRINNNHQGSEIKVHLFGYLTNTISPDDAKQSNSVENKALVRIPRVLVRIPFNFMLVNRSDEYEMKSTVDRYLVNWSMASFGWFNMCWRAGVSV